MGYTEGADRLVYYAGLLKYDTVYFSNNSYQQSSMKLLWSYLCIIYIGSFFWQSLRHLSLLMYFLSLTVYPLFGWPRRKDAKTSSFLIHSSVLISLVQQASRNLLTKPTKLSMCVILIIFFWLGIGYNGFPRGCSDDKLPWAKVGVW